MEEIKNFKNYSIDLSNYIVAGGTCNTTYSTANNQTGTDVYDKETQTVTVTKQA